MKRQGAYLLIAVALATSVSLPALAEGTDSKSGTKPPASARPADSPEHPEDIGKNERGLMIKVIESNKTKPPAKTSKPDQKGTDSKSKAAGKVSHDSKPVESKSSQQVKTSQQTKAAGQKTKTANQQSKAVGQESKPVVQQATTSTEPTRPAVSSLDSSRSLKIKVINNDAKNKKTASVQSLKPKHGSTIMKVLESTAPSDVVPVKNSQKSNGNVVSTTTSQSKSPSSDDQIVTAWLNKTGSKPHYKDGEKLQVNVSAVRDCNVLIFNYDGNMLTQLFPNEYQTSPMLKAGQTVAVGGDQSKFDFTASNDGSKATNEKIFVYAYPLESESSPISVAMAPIPQTPFRGTEFTPEQYRELVNQSKAFTSRRVKVTSKVATELVSYNAETQQGAAGAAPNKIELALSVEAKK